MVTRTALYEHLFDEDDSTLSNLLDPLAVRRPRYRSERTVQHCRKFMPADADELHHVAGLLFARSESVTLDWKVLVEGGTGLRTSEALRLRTDAAPYEPGWMTPN